VTGLGLVAGARRTAYVGGVRPVHFGINPFAQGDGLGLGGVTQTAKYLSPPLTHLILCNFCSATGVVYFRAELLPLGKTLCRNSASIFKNYFAGR
jgi:hypothetical protein